MAKSKTSKVSISNNIIISEIASECYLLNLENSKYTRLNKSAKSILYKIRENISSKDIIQYIHRTYGISIEQASNDYYEFVRESIENNILIYDEEVT